MRINYWERYISALEYTLGMKGLQSTDVDQVIELINELFSDDVKRTFRIEKDWE